jgi:bifunctional enzyme CysN/CysC
MMADGEFVEVFVDTPFEECARRDPKGLYRRAISGELKNFTGVDSPYERPEQAEITLETMGRSPDELVEILEEWLSRRDSEATAASPGNDPGGG